MDLSIFFTGALKAAREKQKEGPVMPKNMFKGRTVSIVTLEPINPTLFGVTNQHYMSGEEKSLQIKGTRIAFNSERNKSTEQNSHAGHIRLNR